VNRRASWALFATLLSAYAYFEPGGGWNQNARFAQVRAIVESGSLSINAYLSYGSEPGARSVSRLVRRSLPARSALPAGFAGLASGDISHRDGRFHPNKPPGLQLLAVPAYAAIFTAERLVGADPDDWWLITLNAHLTSVLSVGLLAAAGAVVFLWTSRRVFPHVPETSHVAAAATLGLATLVFPFATKLMDHVVTGYLSFSAFALLAAAPDDERRRHLCTLSAGALSGFAVVVNYTSILAVLLLGAFAATRFRAIRPLAFFALGGAPSALLLAGYHQISFGHPLHTANHFQPQMMNEEGRFLGMIGVPDLGVGWKLLFSMRHGLFFSSPVLACAVVGFFLAWTRRAARGALVLCAGMSVVTWLLNAAFNGWHGGSSFGPRYLIPALPFLALPLPWAFHRLPRLSSSLALLSFGMMTIANAVSPQVPPHLEDPYREFLLPLLAGGSYVRGATVVHGPVSVNPAGIYEGRGYQIFAEGTDPTRWNAFNLGEFLFPQSAWSILPFLVLVTGGCGLALRSVSRTRRTGPAGDAER
jgi:hypothetical protein